jgi:post-segregation antitoxin (ccd killing protein)
MTTVIRTQIQLTEEQLARVRKIAAARGISIAALIREAVDRSLAGDDRERRWELAMSVVGKYRDRDGATDVSTRHDDYFADAIEERWRR